MTRASDNAFPSILITEGTEPSAPAAGKQRLYIDSTTHKLKATNSSGTDRDIEGGASTNDVPTAVQNAANGASTASLAVTITAAASGQRLVVCIASNARDVNTPTCTNVTFTEVGNANFSTGMYASIYVGVVSGGSSGTTVTVTATGSNFIFARVYEVADALTPTGGTSATLTNTDASAVAYTLIGPIAPTKGTFYAFVAGEDNGTTALRCVVQAPYFGADISNTFVSGIGYAPGGTIGFYTTQGTSGADFAAVIVPIT